MVDARLADGARLHAVIPPLAIDGPCVTIRRFAARPVPLAAFGPCRWRGLPRGGGPGGWNLVVAGGTSAGKTTLLNAVAPASIPVERVVTVEETAELRLAQPHVVRLEARPANAEGAGAVTVRELVRAALRMRPDRIVVGEVRGGEALDMLQALNTGHDGSLSTVHANGVTEALTRLETLVLLADIGLPLGAIRSQIGLVDRRHRLRRAPIRRYPAGRSHRWSSLPASTVRRWDSLFARRDGGLAPAAAPTVRAAASRAPDLDPCWWGC